MPYILSTAPVLPARRYDQEELCRAAESLMRGLDDRSRSVLRRMFGRVGVETRHTALPLEAYGQLGGLGQRSRVFVEIGTDLADRAVRRVLDETQVEPDEIGLLSSTTVTGLAVPSIEARLMNRIPFREDTRRMPFFSLGCVGGAAGIARVADWLRAYPTEAAILVSVELCTLTLQYDDLSLANLVSTALFGDGAAAVLMVGDEHRLAGRGPRVVASRSLFWPNTERAGGWDIVDSGFRIYLSRDIPRLSRDCMRKPLETFLAQHGVSLDEIGAWVTHPGGPKIMDGMEDGLDLPRGTLDPARRSLAAVGNLSSASVLFILDDHLRNIRPPQGTDGMLIALGPAFCAEMVLLRW